MYKSLVSRCFCMYYPRRWNVELETWATLCKGQGHYFGILRFIKEQVPMIVFNVQAFEFSMISWPAKHLFIYFKFHCNARDSFDSSVGRAEDCSGWPVILRSLVRIRLEGNFFSNFFFFWGMALNFFLLTSTLHFSTFYCFFGVLFIEPNTFIKIIIHGIINILDRYVWMECRL